ncbi:hypothetical protein GC098_04795 [Paenibacillus sp. LMG 31458]|uniref:Uncharacterized protein n=1 Tax=Paenibacillus phytorum TaxID=2654977 RepID=A0ABX1XQH6_9BACL|nr:hypothetical protein [Paenibacillus phytorum]NOU70751.1 hypothetical protein [Paenibacillus phytorum]
MILSAPTASPEPLRAPIWTAQRKFTPDLLISGAERTEMFLSASHSIAGVGESVDLDRSATIPPDSPISVLRLSVNAVIQRYHTSSSKI